MLGRIRVRRYRREEDESRVRPSPYGVKVIVDGYGQRVKTNVLRSENELRVKKFGVGLKDCGFGP